jgi:hypothetical protein
MDHGIAGQRRRRAGTAASGIAGKQGCRRTLNLSVFFSFDALNRSRLMFLSTRMAVRPPTRLLLIDFFLFLKR